MSRHSQLRFLTILIALSISVIIQSYRVKATTTPVFTISPNIHYGLPAYNTSVAFNDWIMCDSLAWDNFANASQVTFSNLILDADAIGQITFSTKTANMTITDLNPNGWIKYTVDGLGNQTILYNKPCEMHIDNVQRNVGDGWEYSAGNVTVTSATTQVAMLYGYAVSYASDTLIHGSNFNIYFVDSALTFQAYSNIEFNCASGTWNATNSILSVRMDSGSLSFIPVDNCTLNIGTVADREFSVECSGASLTKTDGNYSVAILSGPRVTIRWRYLPWSLIDNYFMLGVGLTGIVLMIAGPVMFARTFIRHGLDPDTVEWLGYAMLMIVMGFGFLVVWLWPG